MLIKKEGSRNTSRLVFIISCCSTIVSPLLLLVLPATKNFHSNSRQKKVNIMVVSYCIGYLCSVSGVV
jgi:hypothetical protein